ncbi:hypothetical protein CAter282_4528 [Collimonas arenae]|uniref:Uncharacterized protein n=1 Tax=Collimonas arenae TaxID=279058 RepID=A0A127PWU3_9BURK|nr:hypothetical protein CAter10_4928 [Collimonas arenae]AMP12186.1 hypothetical protein CAter282_4528 [Collimonas arenae]
MAWHYRYRGGLCPVWQASLQKSIARLGFVRAGFEMQKIT